MITLTVINNYYQNVTAHPGDTTIKSIDQKILKDVSSSYIEVPGLWNIEFLDLGENHLPAYPKPQEQYGFLIRALSTSAYYRYDDGGNLTVNIDNFGNVALSTTTGTLFPVAMPPLTVSFEE